MSFVTFKSLLNLSLSFTCYQDISVEEFGEELVTKLKKIIDECLKPEKSRPEMPLLLSILKGKVTSRKNRVELYCVGTGTGTTGTWRIPWCSQTIDKCLHKNRTHFPNRDNFFNTAISPSKRKHSNLRLRRIPPLRVGRHFLSGHLVMAPAMHEHYLVLTLPSMVSIAFQKLEAHVDKKKADISARQFPFSATHDRTRV